MKSTSMSLLASAMLSLTSLVSADAASGCEVELKQCQPANYNRVYAGPEFMWSHFPGNKQKLENGTIKWNPNTYYGGLRFGHEYLKPQDFYSNTDVVALMGTTWAEKKEEKEKSKWERTREVFKGERGHFWSNIEQRLGYTFASSLLPSCTLSLYGAPGFHYEHLDGKHAYWYYAATGLKAVQQFTDTFHLGCDVKVMYAFGAHDTHNIATDFGRKQFWGYEVGVPFQWKVGQSKAFDIQLKPYLLKLDVNSSETLLGARVELGYNF